MSPKKLKMELKKNQRHLLEIGVAELVPMLADNKTLRHVRQLAFECHSKDTNEKFQVHVMVTRDEDDFLQPFQTEEME